VTKEAGNPYSKAGDPVEYKVTIKNESSADSPDLVIDKIGDSLQGDLTNSANYDTSTCGASLAHGTSCTIEYTRTVQGGDPDPLKNTVSVETHPTGFPNDVDDSATVEVDLIHPNFTVTKTCTNEPVPQEGPATWSVKITNTGDVPLNVTADDGIGTFTLAAGANQSFPVSQPGDYSGQTTVSNTVTASWTLPESYGLANTDKKSDTANCRVGGRVKVKKLTNGAVDPTQTWSFALYNAGPHADDTDSSFLGSPIATDNTLGDADGVLPFGNANLDPTKTYTVCELSVPTGWTVIWKVDTNNDGTPDTVVPTYNPNDKDVPAQNLGNSCFDFGAGTSYPIPAGGTLAFEIDNTFPGGDGRTIGYWKNWNTCSGGNQAQTAAKNGGFAEGFWLLDDVLNAPGIKLGNYMLPAANTTEPVTNKTGCQIAVRLLNKSDKVTGRNMANDAAYELAAQLIAAKANLTAGAETCAPTLANTILAADTLLASINFNGTGEYLGSKVKGALATKRTQALALAKTLDIYNNGDLC
jgi:hypothetical protein